MKILLIIFPNYTQIFFPARLGIGSQTNGTSGNRIKSEHKTSYNFSLGQPDFSREWITGITWKPDDRNSFSVVNRYNADQDSDTHGFYSTKYIWKHRFCCEVLSVEYKRKHYNHDDSWSVKLDFANW